MAETRDDTHEQSENVDDIAEALLVLANVGYGDFESRIRTHLSPETPLGALLTGIDDMLDALQAEREKSANYQAELEEKLATIEKQRVAIQELSSPIMEVWDGVLCVPIVGVMDSARSAETTESVLRAVADKAADALIIDITGIEVMDTKTVDHFVKMAQAVRLLGASCVITGVAPSIADTVVQMGLDFSGIHTERTLREGLKRYVARLGR